MVANEEAVDLAALVDPLGRRHSAYAFIWAMAGDNQDYTRHGDGGDGDLR